MVNTRYTNEMILSTLLQQLEAFISDRWTRNIWICVYPGADGSQELIGSLGRLEDQDEDILHVYVRKSQRYFEERETTCLDIASITIHKAYRGRGIFSTFVSEAHQRHPYCMTYIESVQNPLIQQWCRKRGWNLDPNNDIPSFFLIKDVRMKTQCP